MALQTKTRTRSWAIDGLLPIVPAKEFHETSFLCILLYFLRFLSMFKFFSHLSYNGGY